MNKTLLILGASSDIGIAVISQLASEFDTIVAHYRSSVETLSQLKVQLGDKLHLIRADFSSHAQTKDFITQVSEIATPTHILHLPAATFKNQNFHKSSWDDAQLDFDVSVRSIYETLQYFIKPMSKLGQTKIVFMLSSVTAVPPKFLVNYTLVKTALLGLMKSLAVEYASKGITINAVSPSMIETKFLKDVPTMLVEQSAASNPIGRNATVEDVLGIIALLLSDQSSYMTGQNIVISGGGVL